jgi:hypothetical protein
MAFGLTRKQRGPNRPFTHSDSCKIVKADPTVQIPWSGRPLRPLQLPPRGPVQAPFHERSCSLAGHLEGSRRRGRGLLVGGMWHLRMRLAGSALRRASRDD